MTIFYLLSVAPFPVLPAKALRTLYPKDGLQWLSVTTLQAPQS